MLRVFERIESSDAAAPNDRPARRRRRRCLAIGLLLLLAAMPAPAMAHDGTGLAGGFVAGLTLSVVRTFGATRVVDYRSVGLVWG